MNRAIFGIDVPPRVQNKYLDYIGKQRVPAGRELAEVFFKSLDTKSTPGLRQAICYATNLTDPGAVWIRSARLSNTFTMVFIGQGSRLHEICSWRALRQMAKAWQHHQQELGNISSPCDGFMFHQAFKYKHVQKIGGGLLKQETQPRDRWKKK